MHREAGLRDDIVVFFTLVDPDRRSQASRLLQGKRHPFRGHYEHADSCARGRFGPALQQPRVVARPDEHYFRRIAAMEFTVEHDDGRNPQDLTEADIVLLGVSRSSKTPISIYMGMEGYKVANVPLALGVEPPKEIYECDPSRIFGLMTTPDILVGIRTRRLGGSGRGAASVAASYAEPEMVYQDLEEARASCVSWAASS